MNLRQEQQQPISHGYQQQSAFLIWIQSEMQMLGAVPREN